jgi:signal transduction histidine kinase
MLGYMRQQTFITGAAIIMGPKKGVCVRLISRDLAPSILSALGLAPALRSLIGTLAKHSMAEITID